MSVKVRRFRSGGWEVDITFRLPNGSRMRERSKAPVSSKSAAFRWGEDRERHLLVHGPSQPTKEVPTLREFAPRFIDGHARANRQKPSGIAGKERVLRVHLLPAPGQPQTRRDQERGRAASEVQAAGEVPEDGQQHPVGLERAVEEGR